LISKYKAIDCGYSGVLLRGSGVLWDLRKKLSYEMYCNMNFIVPYGTVGDSYDRYLIRITELRVSNSLIFKILNKIPNGSIAAHNLKANISNQQQSKLNMENLIHHFKYYSQNIIVPKGHNYVGVEAPKGEFGVYIFSNGTNNPYRVKIRSPGFIHLQSIDFISKNHLIADVVTIIGSFDVVFGEIDR